VIILYINIVFKKNMINIFQDLNVFETLFQYTTEYIPKTLIKSFMDTISGSREYTTV